MQPVSRHRSPGITAIYNAVCDKAEVHIMDLGPFASANFDFFQNLGCHFHFENFAEDVSFSLNADGLSPEPAADRFLADLNPSRRFDIVLIWDLFNFFNLDDQKRLYEKLQGYLNPGAFLFSISYLGAKRPAYPAEFKIADQYFVDMSRATASPIQSAKYTTIEMLKSLPDYQVLRSYLNMQGMVLGISEQVMYYNPQRNMVQSVFSNAEIATDAMPQGSEYCSPSLHKLYTLAAARNGSSVLDLGGRSPRNEEHWKRHFKEVFTLDIQQVIQRIANRSRSEQLEYLRTGTFLNFAAGQTFDVIVAWDLLNYLDDQMVAAFSQALLRFTKDSTLMAAIGYTSMQIPATPRRFTLASQGAGYAIEGATAIADRLTPPLNSLRIQKLLPGFFVQHTYISQPGMQRGATEYLMVFKDSLTLQKDKAALHERVMQQRLERERSVPPQAVSPQKKAQPEPENLEL